MSGTLRSRKHGGASSSHALSGGSPSSRSRRSPHDPSGKDKEYYRQKWALVVIFASLLGVGLFEARRKSAKTQFIGGGEAEPPVRVKLQQGDDAAKRPPAEGGRGGQQQRRDFEDEGKEKKAASEVYDRAAAAEALSFALPSDIAQEADHLGTRLHIVFSTDCSTFQHWQSYLMFYSALRVVQPGRITRIASGCSGEEGKAELDWHNRHIRDNMSPRFGLHLTPHFSTVTDADGKKVGDYKFFNKPFGLKHWLENGEGMGVNPDTGKLRDEDLVVILIDPDMTLLRPITSDFSDKRETLVGREGLWKSQVQHGTPFGQTYGLGTQWREFDLTAIAGANSPALRVSKDDGRDFYPVGPPYLGTARDMHAIATKWSEFAPRVHAQYPHLLAEMYAYCIAAAHLKLPHQKINSLMVSNSGTGGEGWSFVEKIPPSEVCAFMVDGPDHSKYALPSVMHLCQRYIVGPWLFAKRKMPHDFFTCEHQLLEVPPPDLAKRFKYKIKPAEQVKVDISEKVAHEDAFMMCGTIGYLNEAGTYFKRKGCSGNANYEKTLNLGALFKKK
uniref:Uncharacterized protein n=1 Tax=Odontella aurita TaxID=265563 RepID=A0A7S4JEG4_9STRA|mmetsp:Transcript_44389/g.135306  ORF Transcript_44389/g.135306 Transcript_44389/m.135306 type:complete len:558 (+) Transcript_44389:127-1800(+)